MPKYVAMSWAMREQASSTSITVIIQMDTQSAFLRVPSRDALIKLAGHMSLTRDPTAPTSIQVDKSAIALDTEVQELERLCIELKGCLKANGKKIKDAIYKYSLLSRKCLRT